MSTAQLFFAWLSDQGVYLKPWQRAIAQLLLDMAVREGKSFLIGKLKEFDDLPREQRPQS